MLKLYLLLLLNLLLHQGHTKSILDHIPGYKQFDKSVMGFQNQTNYFVVDVEHYQKDHENKMASTGKFGDSLIGPNYQIKISDYGRLKKQGRAKNCTAYINELILIRCADGWVSIGMAKNFFNVVSKRQNYDFDDEIVKGVAD